MKGPRNPTRRNRNIGTAKQGHGANNRNTIPDSWHDHRIFWERLPGCCTLQRRVYQKDLSFYVQPARSPCVHAATPDDIAHLLSSLPPEDIHGLDAILLRQPTKRERALSPVWGRLCLLVEVGRHEGPAIILEACSLGDPIRWSRSLTPEFRRELERLEADGHQIEHTKREYVITPSPDSLRNGILYRTLLHEVGHWVDWKRTTGATQDHPADEELWNIKPRHDKEAAAHRYAEEMADALRAEGKLPFSPRGLEPKAMKAEGLDPQSFAGSLI